MARSVRLLIQDVYKRQEHGQFGNLDEISEPFFLHDLVGHGKLVVDGFLGKYGRPGIEGADILTLQLLRAQVLEKQVQFLSLIHI